MTEKDQQRKKKKLESEQPKWVFLSSDDNTLPPLLCNLSSSSCSSERNKKGMCLLIWKRNDWNSVQYSIRLSTQPNAQPKGYSEKQNIKYNWSWVHRSRCSISCMTECAQTWPHSLKKKIAFDRQATINANFLSTTPYFLLFCVPLFFSSIWHCL